MNETKAKHYGEDEIVDMLKKGQSMIRGSQPMIVDAKGVVLRSFTEGEGGFVEQTLADEVATQIDLEEYVKRNGKLNEDRVYDILEVGYWYKDADDDGKMAYEPVDKDFLEWTEDNKLTYDAYVDKHG